MKKYALTLLFAFALAAMHGQDRGLPERLERSLDSMILDAMQIKAFPGAQLVIGDREGVLYARNYGYHDYSRKREVTDRDLYDVASCTKVVSTTFVVMRLYDRGLLRIDDPLVKYLPEFAGTTAESVTLGELLTHTSGMRAQTFYTPLVRNANGGRLFSGKLSAEYPYRIGKNYFVARDVAIDTLLLSRTPRAGWLETVRQPGRRHADHAADHRGLQAGAQGELPVQRHELLAAETDRGKGLRRIPRPADPRIAVGAGLHVERVQSLANLRHGALRPDRGRPHSEPRHRTRLRP